MKPNAYNIRNEAREERKREMVAAGLVSERFPEVASIVVTLNYDRGSRASLLRTLNFYPGSHAFFKISSPSEGNDAAGVDLTQFIHKMIRIRARTAKGEVGVRQSDPETAHPNVDYEVAITYS